MVMNSQTVGGLTLYCVGCRLAWFCQSLNTKVDDIKWSDSRRVDCILCMVLAGMVYLSLNTTGDDKIVRQ